MRNTALWKLGRIEGYNQGREDGERLGRCKAIVQRMESRRAGSQGVLREVRVLYVRTGLWAYAPLDDGVIDALRETVRELHVADPTDDVASRAAAVGADLVLALNSVECLPAAQVDALRARGIKTAVWFTDDPYYSDVTADIAPHYDYVFTLEESCVPFYQERGCAQVYHLPFGVNTALYHPKRIDRSIKTDICFIGSAFWNRVALFDQIAPYLSGKKVIIAGYWWDRMNQYSLLANQIRLGYWISPEDTAAYYNGAKIVINLHRAIDDESNRNSRNIPAKSVNPRSFEIGACGTLQLTDVREGLQQAYTPGIEIASYSTAEELVERIEYYLQYEEERQQMAYQGLERTMSDHTYKNRVSRMLTIIFG
jgi:spore maturation protein CgeB